MRLERFRIATVDEDGPAVSMILAKKRKSNRCMHAVNVHGAIVQCGVKLYSVWHLPILRTRKDGVAHVRFGLVYLCRDHDEIVHQSVEVFEHDEPAE